MISRVKKTICTLLACVTALPLLLSVPAPNPVSAASDATINLSAQKQVIRGFGGINHPAWAGDLTASQRETAFGNGQNQLGFSVLRIYVDSNRNNWNREVATAKKAIEKGAIVFASPWNPPSDMIETFNRNGDSNAKRLRYDKYAAYAQHLNDFVTYMKNNGVDLYAISVQNEPDYAHDWTWWTPQEILRFMKENAGSINCKVIAPESFQYLKNISDPILNDPQALANMDILGAHLYGTQVSNFAYPLFKQKGAGKELWMTEVYYPNSDNNSADRWPEALEVSYHMHNAMVEGDFQAYVWWYIRRQYGPMKEDGTISKRGYNMAHFSKFVRPGYVRVDATKNPDTNVHVSAYKGNNKVVIVAINRGDSAVNQNFVLQNGRAGTLSRWITDANRNMASEATLNASSGSFYAHLPARSVTTFVGDLTSSATLNLDDAALTNTVVEDTYSK
ncbi:glycoside hydrolase family 30 beta sandwich domain-containing protein [Paenibacillus sp. FSL K6-1230]|uniref:glycoside hydrolase family 30 beta sandwich domain-containing protein n=1 Tax=Paenibacillus sp. FSL K6-1230 TaxID=2921603 RepID=UPI0030F9CCBC